MKQAAPVNTLIYQMKDKNIRCSNVLQELPQIHVVYCNKQKILYSVDCNTCNQQHTKHKSGLWLDKQVHDPMFQWITVSGGHAKD